MSSVSVPLWLRNSRKLYGGGQPIESGTSGATSWDVSRGVGSWSPDDSVESGSAGAAAGEEVAASLSSNRRLARNSFLAGSPAGGGLGATPGHAGGGGSVPSAATDIRRNLR